MGQYTEAVADLTKTLEADPEDTAAYYYRGRAYFSLGQYTYAVADLVKTLEADPENTSAYYYRARAYRSLC